MRAFAALIIGLVAIACPAASGTAAPVARQAKVAAVYQRFAALTAQADAATAGRIKALLNSLQSASQYDEARVLTLVLHAHDFLLQEADKPVGVLEFLELTDAMEAKVGDFAKLEEVLVIVIDRLKSRELSTAAIPNSTASAP